jgi:hypothetical protein
MSLLADLSLFHAALRYSSLFTILTRSLFRDDGLCKAGTIPVDEVFYFAEYCEDVTAVRDRRILWMGRIRSKVEELAGAGKDSGVTVMRGCRIPMAITQPNISLCNQLYLLGSILDANPTDQHLIQELIDILENDDVNLKQIKSPELHHFLDPDIEADWADAEIVV